jgi:V/A-type H+-transporting ATPase subunit K
MFEALADIGPLALDNVNNTVLQQEVFNGNAEPGITADGAAAIGIGLAAIGAGYAERGIGAAAVGALAEDSISTGIGIVMTVLPETLVIFALVALFV